MEGTTYINNIHKLLAKTQIEDLTYCIRKCKVLEKTPLTTYQLRMQD